MQRPRRESVLTTVLFTDIVGSSEVAAELGDRRWKVLLARHHALVRRQLRRFGGKELDTAGDGFFASFDNPGNAVRCAAAVVEAVQDLGIDIRAGLHLGQAEILGRKLGGAAIHVGARTMSKAGPAEVLVTGGLKDVLPPADFRFEDRGTHALKGVPGEWHVFHLTSLDKPLPGPLDPEIAAARRAAVEPPPLWHRRYVPVAGVAVVAIIAVLAIVLASANHPTAVPPSSPTPKGFPAHALLRVNPATGKIEAVLAIGEPHPLPPFGAGVGPAGGRDPGPGPRFISTGEGSVWVTNGGSDSVVRIDPVSLRAQVIPVSGGPHKVAIGNDSVWVISSRGLLTRIDPGTNETTPIDLSANASLPIGLAVDPRGVVYITGNECSRCTALAAPLVRVNPANGSVTPVPLPSHRTSSSVIVSGAFLWMTADGELWKVDPATGTVPVRVPVEGRTGDLTADPSGSSFWISTVTAGGTVGQVIQMDAATGKVIGGQPIGCCPGSIAIGQGYIWATNSQTGMIERISLLTGDVPPPIAVGKGVDGIAVGEGGVWVTIDPL